MSDGQFIYPYLDVKPVIKAVKLHEIRRIVKRLYVKFIREWRASHAYKRRHDDSWEGFIVFMAVQKFEL
jgi:hypothetical protein